MYRVVLKFTSRRKVLGKWSRDRETPINSARGYATGAEGKAV